jgi:hypothetical protein
MGYLHGTTDYITDAFEIVLSVFLLRVGEWQVGRLGLPLLANLHEKLLSSG